METLTTGMSGYFRPVPAVTSSHTSDKLCLRTKMLGKVFLTMCQSSRMEESLASGDHIR